MAQFTAHDMIMVWSVGLSGECYPDIYGVPMGLNGFKYIMVEVLTTAPTTTATYDASILVANTLASVQSLQVQTI